MTIVVPTGAVGVPCRVQRRRTAGWRLPPNTVCVSRPSKFANPFTIADCLTEGFAGTEPEARKLCVDTYDRWLDGDTDLHDIYWVGKHCYDRTWVMRNLHLIAGRSLACWCGEGDACHGDPLLRRANAVAVAQ